MNKGKFQRNAAGKRSKKLEILIIALIVLSVAMIGGTVAYLMTSTNQVTNTFTPAEVEIYPTEVTTPTTKSDIKFQNNGDVPVYIRATLVIYWTDSDDNVVPMPDGGSVTLGALNEDAWVQVGDIIYYHKTPVAPDNWTGVLMGQIEVDVPNGYECHIDVHAEAIQADGMGATSAQDAWNKAANS